MRLQVTGYRLQSKRSEFINAPGTVSCQLSAVSFLSGGQN